MSPELELGIVILIPLMLGFVLGYVARSLQSHHRRSRRPLY